LPESREETVPSACARLGKGLFEGFSARIGHNETGDRQAEKEEDRTRRCPEKMKCDPEGGDGPRRGEADQISGPDAFEGPWRAQRGPAPSQYRRKQVLSGTESQQCPAHPQRGGSRAGRNGNPGDEEKANADGRDRGDINDCDDPPDLFGFTHAFQKLTTKRNRRTQAHVKGEGFVCPSNENSCLILTERVSL